MKIKDKANLRAKKSDELLKLLTDKKLEADKALTEIKGGTEKNLRKASHLRREIAIIATLLTEKILIDKQEDMKKEEQKEPEAIKETK